MADEIFNIAKGSFAEKIRDDATKIGVLLLKVAEADATLRDYATVALLLAGSNTEANFTNYARKTGITATLTVDNTNDRQSFTIAAQTWAAAGGTTDNSLVKAVIYYDESGTDATRIPISHHDFVVTTSGGSLVLTPNTNGIARAS